MDKLVIKGKKIYTVSKEKFSWYGEKVLKKGKVWLREFNPLKSKIAAAIRKGFRPKLKDQNILYLGCSTGTTVSHLSDLTDGQILGVDVSAFVMRDFVRLSMVRSNVVPLLHDAGKLDTIKQLNGKKFEIVFEDIAQKNMVDIFIKNLTLFLDKNGEGWLSLKTRSIDSTKAAKKVLDEAIKKIEEKGFKVVKVFNLEPFEKQHYFLVVRWK